MTCKTSLHTRTTRALTNGVSFSIASLPDQANGEAWQRLASKRSVFLDLRYCTAMHEAQTDCHLRCVTFFKEGTVIGIAVMQLVDATASLTDTGNQHPRFMAVARSFLRSTRIQRRILVVGSSFATGEHGFAFDPAYSAQAQIALVAAAAESIVAEERRSKQKVSAVLMKDFYDGPFANHKTFKEQQFTPVHQEPNLLLPLLPEWHGLDDYLEALTTKYRTKARAALERSAELELRTLSHSETVALSDDLYGLYGEVKNRAAFALGGLSPQALPELVQRLGDDFTLMGYFNQGALVGFQSAFRNGACLDAHFVGFDYGLNHRLALYPRMLYEFIRLGIEGRYTRINFGRTATEIKSTVGALPVEMHCYMRHTAKASNAMVHVFAGFVGRDAERSHLAWKRSVLPALQTMLPSATHL